MLIPVWVAILIFSIPFCLFIAFLFVLGFFLPFKSLHFSVLIGSLRGISYGEKNKVTY